MPASEAQIRANRANAMLSSGPTSPEGKVRSRANATKHGMAGESASFVEAGLSDEFERRRTEWAVEQRPVGKAAGWALDRAVAASLRIELCERAVGKIIASSTKRAELTWDEDRDVEAATAFGRLAKDPVLASRQLRASLAGVRLLIEAWFGLIARLEAGEDWSESEASKALDLLGVAPDLRSGRTRIDSLEKTDSKAFRARLALDELSRLEALRDEALVPIDEMERGQAREGEVALLSKRASLVLRYEREAWRRYRESMQELKTPDAAESPPAVVVAPPRVVTPPQPPPRAAVKRPAVPASPSFEEERRALLAEAAPYFKAATDDLIAMGLVDEDAWFEELERQEAGLASLPGSFLPIAAGVGPVA
jgi:hypothetical protein